MPNYEQLRADFLRTSRSLFHLVRDEVVRSESWTFSLADPDGPLADIDPASIADPRGAAAFMLRRIQAIRYLLKDPQQLENPHAVIGFASDLTHQLEWLPAHMPDHSNRDVVLACAQATRNVLAYSVNASLDVN